MTLTTSQGQNAPGMEALMGNLIGYRDLARCTVTSPIREEAATLITA